jgi:iron complex outermembrane receptor protein
MQCKKSFLMLTAISAALASMGAHADEKLGDVVVTASRVEQSTLEAPANVTVVKSDTIEASGAVRVGDALTAKVPSFYMRGGTGPSSRLNSTPIVSMRGQYNRVKMMVDGISLSDGNNGGPASILGLNVGDVQQIEIVPGTSSALYGSDAVGGVVNIISKVPTKEEMNAKYSHGFGDNERNAYDVSYRNRWENGLAASIGAGYEDMAGFAKGDLVVLPVGTTGTGANAVQGGKATTTTTGAPAYIVGDKGATPSRASYLNGKLYFELDAKSKLFAGFALTEGHQGYENFNNYLSKNGAPLSYPASNVSINGDKIGSVAESKFWNSSNPNSRQESRVFAGYDGKLRNGMDLKVNVGYFDRKSSYVASGTGATFDGGPGTMTSTPNTTFDGSAQLGFDIGEKQYFIAGLSNSRSTLDRKVYQLTNWRTPDSSQTGALTEASQGDSSIKAIFFQDQIFLTDAFTLYAGGRYDYWTTSGVSYKYSGSAPLGTVNSPERSASAFSPKLAAVLRWTETLSLRSSIGTAFRAPSNYEMYATPSVSGNRLLIADPNVKPETATSWDIGIEKALPENGSLKAAYYRTRLQDMIYRKTSPYSGSLVGVTTNATTTNAGEAKVQGVELSGEMPVTRWLRASASYTYTDSEITKDDSGTGLLGKRLRYVPKNMVGLGLDAQWQKWRGFLSTTYTGLQYGQEDNSDVVNNVYGGTSQSWLTNLQVSYQIDKNFKTSLRVNNLLNTTYYEYYLMPGRNAAIEVSAAF